MSTFTQSKYNFFANPKQYNTQKYTSVLDAAQGIAQPFLAVQQQNTGNVINVDSETNYIVINNQKYQVINKYENPEGLPKRNDRNYYIGQDYYFEYGLLHESAWPIAFPNITYSRSQFTFTCEVDCVGYGCRVLSAVGLNGQDAYSELIDNIHRMHEIHFAERGVVASAFEFAIAFPLFPTINEDEEDSGWYYVSGNVDSTYFEEKGLNYYGVPNGDFRQAKAGDILSFGYIGYGANGHFMVLLDSPLQLSPNNVPDYLRKNSQEINWNQYNVYAVDVLDCSGMNAHFNDSRRTTSGIGTGTLIILTDKNEDIPIGFIFGPSPSRNDVYGKSGAYIEMISSLDESSHVVAITVGRYRAR
ncbi:hypothetical protein A0J48_017515 [Sphaerospermopsis aphanizomenoides BCCUSP55]|uniref:hypothetical protein n=1 Tax=Sphaerospermopsis aphanizomenoides TaxID=459663 RepID=UPI001905022F|nr:hypothetical protein [Sphaerospermopsis aphanizomenoides]MBK1989313.1 hypothetical protein [Sphaerospermopsis aphanizomenoides BCCUSP55]